MKNMLMVYMPEELEVWATKWSMLKVIWMKPDKKCGSLPPADMLRHLKY